MLEKILGNKSDSALILRKHRETGKILYSKYDSVFIPPPSLVWEENQLIIRDTTIFATYTA